jgi:cytochrome c
LFPAKWTEVRGFFSALMLPNVWPRYIHFVLASFSATGLFCAWYFGRHQAASVAGFSKPELRRMFYWITFYATLAQFAAGPLVLFTLPSVGLSRAMVGLILCGATLGLISTSFLWFEIKESDENIGRGFWLVTSLFAGTVLFMATGRHLYRDGALHDHRELVAAKTRDFMIASEVANASWQAELAKYPDDERLFQRNCSACHALDTVKVGPSLREVASVYKDNQEGIVRWAMAPGKKRPTFPKMPSMKHVGEKNLREIAKYIFRTTSAPPPPANPQSDSDAAQKGAE